jgi:hypothetical protein
LQVFDNNILELFQVLVRGVLEFGYSFHTSSAHRHDDTRNKPTAIAGFFVTNARGTLASHAINSALLRSKEMCTFLPFAGGGKYSGPNTSTDFVENSFVATLFDMMSIK